jgi:hypothetical protein
MTDPTGTPYRDDLPGDNPRTTRTEAEFVDSTHDRSIRLSTVNRGADILRDAAMAFRDAENERTGGEHNLDEEYFRRLGYAQLKTLMLAGWLAPDEATLGVPNGLVLAEGQWRALDAGESVEVMLPGGEKVLALEAVAWHGNTHFQPDSELHDDLWSLRERVREEQRRLAEESHRLDAWYSAERRAAAHDVVQVRVPKSFLTFLTRLAESLHADKQPGSEAAAHALDNGLALVAEELRAAGVTHRDRGVERTDDAHVAPWAHGAARGWGKTFTTTNYWAQAEQAVRLHNERLIDLRHEIRGVSDEQLRRDVITVLRYVSGGREHVDVGKYPDFQARRALGALDVQDSLRGRELAEVLSGRRESEAELIDLRHELDRRNADCDRVKQVLFPILSTHAQTRDGLDGVDTPAALRAGHLGELAAKLLNWYAAEIRKLRREGVPAVTHDVDRAFHDLAIKERDLERVKVERLEAELATAREKIAQLESTVIGLELDLGHTRPDNTVTWNGKDES